MSRPPQDLYARLLSPRGYGYPLWTPEPSNELLVQRRDGLRIGDVGVVIPDDGGFDVLFNICLPSGHPFHRRYGVPEGFTCINCELDIRTNPNAEQPGRIISTSSVTHVETAGASSDAPQRDESGALAHRFTLSSKEGALLILPEGAERYDILDEGLFLEQASRHGVEWYNYATNRRHRIISHDSLYLITGFYKARSWSVAAFEDVVGNQYHTAHFRPIQEHNSGQTYSWEATCALDWRVGPHIDYDIPNQAVFIRGFKIALRTGFLGTRQISVEADFPSARHVPAKSSDVVPGSSWLINSLARLLRRRKGSNVSQTTARSPGTSGSSGEKPRSHSEHDVSGTHVEVQRVPDVSTAFHPSEAINQYLLRKEPSANIAITHDSQWISILEDGQLTPNELEQESCLERALSQNYHVVLREGVVHLERKSDPDALDDNVLHVTAEVNQEEQSPSVAMDKMKSQFMVNLQRMRDIALRAMSLALKKTKEDVGLEAISAILKLNRLPTPDAAIQYPTSGSPRVPVSTQEARASLLSQDLTQIVLLGCDHFIFGSEW